MSDSFADLWSSSAAIPPKTKPQTLPARAAVDAFSDLFSSTASSATTSNGNRISQTGLTLAQRLALEAQAKEKEKHSTRVVEDLVSQDSAWLGLDSLARSGAGSSLSLGEQREDLLDTAGGNRADDDILGILSQPVEVVKAQTQREDLLDVVDTRGDDDIWGLLSQPVQVAKAQQPPQAGPPKGLRERERERRRRERHREASKPPPDAVLDVQERLISQASEIGLSVLNKASALWKETKEQVVKAYEERAVTPVAGHKERPDREPKWMKDGTFKDEDDEDGHPKANETPPSQVAVIETPIPPIPTPPPTRDRPLPTTSPSRLSSVDKHRTVANSQFKLGQYASAIESYSAAINILPPGHLLLLPLFNNRSLARMRTGEYTAAADDAAQALRIVLVLDDGAGGPDEFDPTHATETAIHVTTSSWHPSMEPAFLLAAAQQKANSGGWTHPQGFGVDLVDGYVKALRRRAESSEGRERWSDALKFWELLTSGESAVIKEDLRESAQRSAARCRTMMVADADGTLGDRAPKPKLKSNNSKPKMSTLVAPPPPTTTPSAALRSLQATNAQSEAEDKLKHQLKDAVDSKLGAWRTGKETNIRALLASLDMVLWEELLRGVKVGGLHELVTPAQVKKGYMKAIARVHPDKLNAQNATVEQRMLANGVFGTLSEAWTSFQGSNGVS